MAYPLMLYRAGLVLDDYIVVEDAEEEAQAGVDGYKRLDLAAAKAGVKPPESEPRKRGRPRKVQQ